MNENGWSTSALFLSSPGSLRTVHLLRCFLLGSEGAEPIGTELTFPSAASWGLSELCQTLASPIGCPDYPALWVWGQLR